MDTFIQTGPSCTVEEAAVFTNSILNMLITDMRPLSMVEDTGFINMIKAFNPKYTIPSRTHFTNMMSQKYSEITEKLKSVLKETECVALTTDIWTSVATEAYLGVTCHFLGDDWKIKSLSLTTMPLDERHTATNIADWLEDAATKFHISFEKVKAVVHDNGANVVAAAKILKERHGWASVRCAGHTLNVVVQNTLKNNKTILSCVASARCLVEHFKKSELACTKLKEKQQQMGVQQHMLVQDVSTRWNSTLHMLSRLLEQRWPVTAALSGPAVNPRGKNQHLDLKPEQWIMTEELTQILEPFKGATVFLSGEQYVTLSALPLLVQTLKKSTLSSTVESAPVRAFQGLAAEQITERWEYLFEFKPDNPNTALLAAALDPRFRKPKFLPSEESLKKTTVQLLQRSNQEDEDEKQNQEVQKEVLQYFGEHPLSKKENPLQWWRENAARYPNLAKLAKSFLSIPATSSPSERLFSAAGNIASKRRASLTSDNVNMLTFLHCNHHLLF
ncbi:E3 SUMO-protein ligase ZBED1-like [Brachyhypopomus gauderio]|uniref:E3 SUMO-protein ligase ZBED1-like n=1 Tax=Brachyhypopomus gauderio TaxID=698409 RepID=UPI004041A3F7